MSNSKGSIKTKQYISQGKQRRASKYYENETVTSNKLFYIPLIIILGIIPFISRLKLYNPHLSQVAWFPSSDSNGDLFLYYKQWSFIGVAFIMAIIILVKAYIDRKSIRFAPVYIPLSLYAALSLLSAIFSQYKIISFNGGFEQFESVFAQLGYCLVVYYIFLFIQSEKDIKVIINFFVYSIIVMSILGTFQFMGYDFFTTKLAYNLMIPSKLRENMQLDFNFPKNRVYLSLYNPNYVGVYTALIAPLILILTFFQKKIYEIILFLVALIGIVISLIGSQSLAGIVGLGVSVVCVLVFMWRYLLKRFYILIPVVILLLCSLLILNKQTEGFMVNRIQSMFDIEKSEKGLTDLRTEDNNVSLTYNGNNMQVIYMNSEVDSVSLVPLDSDGKEIACGFDEATGVLSVMDERFKGITLGFNQDNTSIFYIKALGQTWDFTNQYGDGTYYYVTRFGKLDKLITAPSAIFTGYEKVASRRGYIWSRTIPLLKNYIVLGSGSDTFVTAFPQQDYMNLKIYGYANQILTKPHNLYLQIAVQTGVLSLIAFLVFYGMYFVMSIRLYIKGLFHSYYAQVGVAIFIGTISYMVTGLTNDSSITTAPIFWTLIGIGIAANYKAKPLIMEEYAKKKAEKLESKKLRVDSKNEINNY